MLSHVESLNARLASLELKLSQEQRESADSRLTSLRAKGIVERREGGTTRLTGLQLERQGMERLGERVPVSRGYDFEEDTMEQFVGKTMGERLAWLVKKMWVKSKLLGYESDEGISWVIDCYTKLMKKGVFTFGDFRSGVEIALAKMASKDEMRIINLIEKEVWEVVRDLEVQAKKISSHSHRP